MRIADLGERAAIRRLIHDVGSRGNVLGFTDDCAALCAGGECLVLSTDAATRATHFPASMTMAEIGAFATEIALSDIAAMGAEPVGVLVAMGLPPGTEDTDLDGLREGILGSLARVDAELLGGDMKANTDLTLVVTALGRVAENRMLRRSGAEAGDAIVLTGTVGGAGAGAAALDHGLHDRYLARLIRPLARIEEGRALSTAGAHAAMDLSDGLAEALHAVADASGVGFTIDPDSLPVDDLATTTAATLGDPALARSWALDSGGDYELLAAIPEAILPRGERGIPLTVIGTVESDSAVRRFGDGQALARRGFEHFR